MNNRQRLSQINDAITAIEIGGQEYQLGPRKLKRADLGLLYNQRDKLMAEVHAEEQDSRLLPNTSVAVFFDRR